MTEGKNERKKNTPKKRSEQEAVIKYDVITPDVRDPQPKKIDEIEY